jgi:hypothetical protein
MGSAWSEAAAIFQQRHGRNLTFTLMTLPDFDNDQLLLISQSWAWSGE